MIIDIAYLCQKKVLHNCIEIKMHSEIKKPKTVMYLVGVFFSYSRDFFYRILISKLFFS